MRQPYTPRSLVPELQGDVDRFYQRVETEVALEDKGYILKMYVDGKHVGGLPQLADAMKVNG
jgi:hypothetical protein